MSFVFKLSYNKGNALTEVESQKGKKQAGLSFELSVVCDPQMSHLISWGIAMVIDLIRQYMT